MKQLTFVSIFIFISLLAFGQVKYSTDSKKAIKSYEEALTMLSQRRFPEAIQKLNDAVEKDNDFIEAHLRLAFSYELLRNINGQQYHLEQIIRIAPNTPKYKNVYYSLGKVYFNQGKYQESGDLLDKLKSMGIENDRIRVDIEALSANIDFAKEHIQNPLDIEVIPLPRILNAFALQYFPVLTADENTIIYTAREGVSFHDDENIVTSEKDASGNWSKPHFISPNINSQFNEGTCTISADGRILIFTNCEGRPRVGSCDLYISYKTGDEWSVPKNLGRNINSRSWDSQPALSADGSKLFFVSDRAGGVGKRDIWMSQKDGLDEWQMAVNLGPAINTAEDEVSPFIHVNGTSLFFASKGFPGFGGFDLYKTELNENLWAGPENLGYPINTYEDQVSLFVSTNGENGYYAFEKVINENQKQSLLYTFKFPDGGILENKSLYITGNVFDAESQEPLDARIELIDLGSEQRISVFTSDPITGKYFSILNENRKIALYVEKEGYLFESKSFELISDSIGAITQDFYLNPIKTGVAVRLNNIFFEFNSASLTNDSKTELDKIVRFLTLNPGIKIRIAGHTDDQGTPDYNMILSEKRAKAVYDFLINQDINPDALTFVGYGETKPVLTNDDEKSRQINRRIEFSITEQ